MVTLVVLGTERLEHEALGHRPGRWLEVRWDERHSESVADRRPGFRMDAVRRTQRVRLIDAAQ